MVRIEIQLTVEESETVKQIAKEEGRSRKKQCEVYIRKMIEEYKGKENKVELLHSLVVERSEQINKLTL